MLLIYVNFWHLKSRNGMAYYGERILQELSGLGVKVVARKGRCSVGPDAVKGTDLLLLSRWEYILFCFHRVLNRSSVFCPTSHAIPFVTNQVCAVHDLYPFEGAVGKVKFLILYLSWITSGCKLLHINKTVGDRLGRILPSSKLIFSPNLVSVDRGVLTSNASVCRYDPVSKISIGLVGTDSDKKNYFELLDGLTRHRSRISIKLYGGETAYKDKVVNYALQCNISLDFYNSDELDLEQFLSTQVDVVISNATGEGFGRPIAMAALLGIPTVLRDDPIFKEFYSDTSHFFSSQEQLLSILDGLPSLTKNRTAYFANALKLEEYLKTSWLLSVTEIKRALVRELP